MEKVYFEDYEMGEVPVSPGRTITETDIIMFASMTGDWHPIHTNVELAKKTMFGGASPTVCWALPRGGAHLSSWPLCVYPQKFIAFYGMDKIHFTDPIKIGDTIRCEATVAELKARDEATGTIAYEASIKN